MAYIEYIIDQHAAVDIFRRILLIFMVGHHVIKNTFCFRKKKRKSVMFK